MEEFALKINDIFCCSEKRPIGISDVPVFSFELEAVPLFNYGGCQIQVASEYRFLENGMPDMWESGTVRGEMRPVRYAGKPLKSFTRYFWRVRVLV